MLEDHSSRRDLTVLSIFDIQHDDRTSIAANKDSHSSDRRLVLDCKDRKDLFSLQLLADHIPWIHNQPLVSTLAGRAIAQAVSRWLPTAAARVRSRVWSSGICGGQSGAGVGFLRVLRFSLPIFIPPNNSPSSQSPGAGTIGQ
jgi:hypothetical protein